MNASSESRSAWTCRCLCDVLIALGLSVPAGCGGQFPGLPAGQQVPPPARALKVDAPPVLAPQDDEQANQPRCRVHGRIVSNQWRDLGGDIERAIVAVWTDPGRERIKEVYGEGEAFAERLPPGKYRLICSAVGTRGATFESLVREITVAEDQDDLDVGSVDLPISKSTELYGKVAPELTGVIAWQDSPPLQLKALRGHVVVLEFFAHYCSICHEYKPDLIKLRDKYDRQGLVVVALHDSSVPTLEAMNARMESIFKKIYAEHSRHLPVALDGMGDQSVFEAYGIYAVPAVMLIDQQGRVVRRYHHAGKPELEADVQLLLTRVPDSIQ